MPRFALMLLSALLVCGGLSACAVVSVVDAAVSVGVTAVKVGATVVETAVDVTAAGVKAATGADDDDGETGAGGDDDTPLPEAAPSQHGPA